MKILQLNFAVIATYILPIISLLRCVSTDKFRAGRAAEQAVSANLILTIYPGIDLVLGTLRRFIPAEERFCTSFQCPTSIRLHRLYAGGAEIITAPTYFFFRKTV
jgi:hypothetical protein